jgi:hypothetical protein
MDRLGILQKFVIYENALLSIEVLQSIYSSISGLAQGKVSFALSLFESQSECSATTI